MRSLTTKFIQLELGFRSVIFFSLLLIGAYISLSAFYFAAQDTSVDLKRNTIRRENSDDTIWGYFKDSKMAIGLGDEGDDVSCDVSYETSTPPLGSRCYLRDRLKCPGMPTIHSAFIDVVTKQVVFTGTIFLSEGYAIETYLCEFPDGSSSVSDPILNDTRSFGGQPQFVIVITFPLTDSYLKEMEGGTIGTDQNPVRLALRRALDPRRAYRGIPACTTGFKRANRRNFLSLCTMAKGMDDFFRVWLLYYRFMGVDHAYIYDNSPESSLIKVLRPFVRIGFVTVIPWAHQHTATKTYLEVQIAHENDCLWRHRHDTKWVIKVDVDEFMQPMDPQSPRIIDFINNFGEIPPSVATLRVRNWFFSKLPSNVSRDILYAGTVIERNPWRPPEPTEENRGRDKCLVLPERVHYFKIHGVKIGGDTITLNPTSEMRLVHYRSENPMHRNFRIHQFVRDDSMRDLWERILHWKDRTEDRYIRWTYKKGAPVDDVHPYKKPDT